MKKKLSELIKLFNNSGIVTEPVISNEELKELKHRLERACELISDVFGSLASAGLMGKLHQVDDVISERGRVKSMWKESLERAEEMTEKYKLVQLPPFEGTVGNPAACGICGEVVCDCAERVREKMLAKDPSPPKPFSFKGNPFTLWQIHALVLSPAIGHWRWIAEDFTVGEYCPLFEYYLSLRKNTYRNFLPQKGRGKRHD